MTLTEDHIKPLFLKALDGETVAYEQFLNESRGLLGSFFSKRLFAKDSIEDLVQETLVAIHKSRHTFRPDRPLLPWIFAIAKYKLTDHLRKLKGNVSLDDHTHVLDASSFDQYQEPEDIQEELQDALKQLPERTAEIIRLNKLEGYPFKEVAAHLNMSEVAVKTAASRGYKQLHGILVKKM